MLVRIGRFLRVGEQLALVGRVLVEDVDARAQHVLRLDGQIALQLAQRGQRRGIDEDDLQIAVGHEHVGRGVFEHGCQPRLLGLDPLALADVFPGDDVAQDRLAAGPKDAVDVGLQGDVAEGELGLVRQGLRRAQDAFDASLSL